MINFKIKVTLFVLMLSVFFGFAQPDSMKYEKGFEFKEGIYITLSDFKNNSPNLTPENFEYYNPGLNYNSGLFERKNVRRIRKLNYPDSGSIKSVDIDSVFGYSDKYKLHCYFDFILDRSLTKQFIRMQVVTLGIICLAYKEDSFIEKIYSDYGIDQPLFHSKTNYPKFSEQYLILFNSWKIKKFSITNFSSFLKVVDEGFYTEFMALSNSKRRKLWFVYLQKLNASQPVYFPVNK